MDRRDFLTLTAGLSSLLTSSVEAALSLDEVQSGLALNKDGRQISHGNDFLDLEEQNSVFYLDQLKATGGIDGKPLHKDPNAQKALQSIYLPLVKSSTRSNLKWKIYLITDQTLNAFTGGAGLTFVYDHLIRHCKTEAELVSVLAHEIGHIEHKHIARRLMSNEILKQYGVNINYIKLKSGKKVKDIDFADYKKSQGRDISLSKMMEISLDIFERNFTRMFEHQADAMILKVFVDHGYDLNLANTFNQMMLRKYGSSSPNLCLYSTHPAQIERMARIGEIANTMTNSRKLRGDSDAFLYLKDRIGHIEV